MKNSKQMSQLTGMSLMSLVLSGCFTNGQITIVKETHTTTPEVAVSHSSTTDRDQDAQIEAQKTALAAQEKDLKDANLKFQEQQTALEELSKEMETSFKEQHAKMDKKFVETDQKIEENLKNEKDFEQSQISTNFNIFQNSTQGLSDLQKIQVREKNEQTVWNLFHAGNFRTLNQVQNKQGAIQDKINSNLHDKLTNQLGDLKTLLSDTSKAVNGQVDSLKEGLSSVSTTVTAQGTQLNAQGTQLKAQGGQLKGLAQSLEKTNSNVGGMKEDLNSVSTTVTAQGMQLNAQGTQLKAQGGQLNDLAQSLDKTNSNVGGIKEDLNSVSTTVTAQDEKLIILNESCNSFIHLSEYTTNVIQDQKEQAENDFQEAAKVIRENKLLEEKLAFDKKWQEYPRNLENLLHKLESFFKNREKSDEIEKLIVQMDEHKNRQREIDRKFSQASSLEEKERIFKEMKKKLSEVDKLLRKADKAILKAREIDLLEKERELEKEIAQFEVDRKEIPSGVDLSDLLAIDSEWSSSFKEFQVRDQLPQGWDEAKNSKKFEASQLESVLEKNEHDLASLYSLHEKRKEALGKSVHQKSDDKKLEKEMELVETWGLKSVHFIKNGQGVSSDSFKVLDRKMKVYFRNDVMTYTVKCAGGPGPISFAGNHYSRYRGEFDYKLTQSNLLLTGIRSSESYLPSSSNGVAGLIENFSHAIFETEQSKEASFRYEKRGKKPESCNFFSTEEGILSVAFTNVNEKELTLKGKTRFLCSYLVDETHQSLCGATEASSIDTEIVLQPFMK